MLRSTSALGVLVAITSCAHHVVPMRSGALIDQYARAACVPARRAGPDAPPEWDQVVQGHRCQARIVGRVASTGFVGVEPDKAPGWSASYGEKSNPQDVRFDPGSCRLYVRSYGTPLFVERVHTWLVEYDLEKRQEVQRAVVEQQVLPALCP